LVSIDPKTGDIKAYYGGHSGSGLDYAGIYSDPVLDNGDWSGAHAPPGSTFKLYTLATALSQGISIDSYWSGPPRRTSPAYKKDPAGSHQRRRGGDSCPKDTGYVCTCSTPALSMNTVFYGVGVQVGADRSLMSPRHGHRAHLGAGPDPNNPKNKIDKRFDLADMKARPLPQFVGNRTGHRPVRHHGAGQRQRGGHHCRSRRALPGALRQPGAQGLRLVYQHRVVTSTPGTRSS